MRAHNSLCRFFKKKLVNIKIFSISLQKFNNKNTNIMNISELNTSRLNALEGCEINSVAYEGYVMVESGKVWQDGEVVDTLDSNKKVQYLWHDYLEQEVNFY